MSSTNISEHDVLEHEQIKIGADVSASKSFDLNVFSVAYSKALRKFWYIVLVLAVCYFTSLVICKKQ